MPNALPRDLEQVKVKVDALSRILADPHPGLISWNAAVSELLIGIVRQQPSGSGRSHQLMAKPKRLPPDPDGQNDERAEWAERALLEFIRATRTDEEDALMDLLGDLMHWADRNDCDFEHELRRARTHYEAETMGDTPDQAIDPKVARLGQRLFQSRNEGTKE